MFPSLARLVQRHSWFVVLAWAVVTFLLFRYAPLWEQVTKDDDVRFFPPRLPERDRPGTARARASRSDAASSQVVLVYERAGGPADPGRLRRPSSSARPTSTSSAEAEPEPRRQEDRHPPDAGHRPAADRHEPPTVRARRC